MSGIEVAGLVLGALPLMIEALNAYKQGKGVFASMRKTRGLLDDLIHHLKTQRTEFYLDILELLREARVPAILEESDPDEERCISILEESRTGDHIQEYLGHLYEHFLETLGYYERYLKDIALKLEYITRPENAAKDDLAALIRANQAPDSIIVVKTRIKFTMDRSSLKELVQDLGTERYHLGKLIQRVKSKREWEACEPTSSSTVWSKTFARARKCADLLYAAAAKCWACDQHTTHSVMMRLDHRIPPSRAPKSELVHFGLCFPIGEADLQEIEVSTRAIQPMKKKRLVAFQEQTAECKKQKAPTVTICEPDDTHPAVASNMKIKSICHDAQKARDEGKILNLSLTSDVLELCGDVDHKPHQPFHTSQTLANLLSEMSPAESARVKILGRTKLALNIAASVVQLRETTWCDIPWDSSAIKFPATKTHDGAVKMSFTPYVEHTFDDEALENGPFAPRMDTQMARDTLLELAILLLEIMHLQAIEAWAAANEEGRTERYQDRMGVAKRWADESTAQLLPQHIRPIEECLRLCARSKLSWDDDFQKRYCENVIKPLQELVL